MKLWSKNLLKFKRLKKTILLYIACHIPESDIEHLKKVNFAYNFNVERFMINIIFFNNKKVFVSIDTNGNGLLSKDEMITGLI